MHILSIFGTRPEAIKMAPVVKLLSEQSEIVQTICITGQHREMLDTVLRDFDITPEIDLQLMSVKQGLNSLFARVLTELDPILEQMAPDLILVHGDTTTAAASALAAFHRNIPVAHVEAGLRSGSMQEPFPEELNRQLIDRLATWLFAPTHSAKANLFAESALGKIVVTGNTVIDSLQMMMARIQSNPQWNVELETRFSFLRSDAQLILVTSHRRENIGEGLEEICDALIQISKLPNMQIVYPVHLNPSVRAIVLGRLKGCSGIHLLEPTDYREFVWLMMRSNLILTDSGGIQEEGVFLGKPVLVMRNVTERGDAMESGLVELVGTHTPTIVHAVKNRLQQTDYPIASNTIFGDGQAAQRIVDALLGKTVREFSASPLHD